MTINGRKLNTDAILALAIKPLGKVTGNGCGVMREANILRIHHNHKLVAAHVYPTPAEAIREFARIR